MIDSRLKGLSSRARFMKTALAVVRDDPDHPLRSLLSPKQDAQGRYRSGKLVVSRERADLSWNQATYTSRKAASDGRPRLVRSRHQVHERTDGTGFTEAEVACFVRVGRRQTLTDAAEGLLSAKEVAILKAKIAAQIIVHAGHQLPGFAGGTQLALECAWTNVELTSQGESAGVIDQKLAVSIQGVPVELDTARFLARCELLGPISPRDIDAALDAFRGKDSANGSLQILAPPDMVRS